MEEFRNIYHLTVNKKSFVSKNFVFNNGGVWVPRLRRNLNDWEMEELTSLLGLLKGSRPRVGI